MFLTAKLLNYLTYEYKITIIIATLFQTINNKEQNCTLETNNNLYIFNLILIYIRITRVNEKEKKRL